MWRSGCPQAAGGPTADRTGEPKILRGPDAKSPQVDT